MWEFIEWLLSFIKSSTPPKHEGVLVLIVGHNSKAPGAFAAAPLSMSEYQYNKKIIVPECEAYAKTVGLDIEVIYKDGMTTTGVGMRATRIVQSVGKGCVVELHFNAANGLASGTETLYNSARPSNKEFAEIIQRHMVGVFGKPNRGLVLRDSGRGSSNLAAVKVTSVLVEPLFGDTDGDAQLLRDKSGEYAKSIVNAALEYLS